MAFVFYRERQTITRAGKNDKTDSYKIAKLLKGGNFPMAYANPTGVRATRDLLHRRSYMINQCSLLVGQIFNTNTQYNLPAFNKKLSRKFNHEGVVERFGSVQQFSSYARLIRPEKESGGK